MVQVGGVGAEDLEAGVASQADGFARRSQCKGRWKRLPTVARTVLAL